jgi:predicted CoA-binding protein
LLVSKGALVKDDNIMRNPDEIASFLRGVKTVAVLGIKPETHSGQPAHYVAASLHRAGLRIIPVPVYYPEVTEILGQKVFRRVSDIGEPIDIVDVFRRPNDIEQHIEDILAAKPRMVWFQSGIRHDGAARQFADAGIKVVQDQCLMVEYGQIRAMR